MKTKAPFVVLAVLVLGLIVYGFVPRNHAGAATVVTSGKNSLGELGNRSIRGTTGQVSIPEKVRSIAAGFDHTLVLTTSGNVYSWGDNTYGQLGLDSAKGVITSPRQVKGLPKIVAVSAGFRHSMALDGNGRIWVWGNNIAGQLGTGDRTDLRKPKVISLPSRATTIAAGHRFSLATLDDGRVFGWGAKCQNAPQRTFAELMQMIGQSATGISYYVDANADPSSSQTQELCEFQGFVAVSSLTPVAIPELRGSKQLVAGFGHLLALQADGTVKSKGCNAYGQLGYPTADIVPAETIPGLKDITAIAASTRHSLALDSSGNVWAWGADNTGQLGKNLKNLEGVFEPEKVAGLPEITAIAAGHDASYALDANGNVWAWGDNNSEQARGVPKGHYNAVPAKTSLRDKQHIISGGAFTVAY